MSAMVESEPENRLPLTIGPAPIYEKYGFSQIGRCTQEGASGIYGCPESPTVSQRETGIR